MRTILFRIGLWACAGFLVSAGWGLYFAERNKDTRIAPAVNVLARITQPVAGAILYLDPHARLDLVWVLVATVATYALLGWMVKTLPTAGEHLAKRK